MSVLLPHRPPAVLPFAQTAVTMGLVAVLARDTQAPEVVACFAGIAAMGIYSGMYYSTMIDIAGRWRENTAQQVELADAPTIQLDASWKPYVYAAETEGMRPDLVHPAIPDGLDILKVRQVALKSIRGKMTHAEIVPAILSRDAWDELRGWLLQQQLAAKVGNTRQIELTPDGRGWMRDVLAAYPAPMKRVR